MYNLIAWRCCVIIWQYKWNWWELTNKTAKLQDNKGRTKEDIVGNAIKELECLAEYMQDIL